MFQFGAIVVTLINVALWLVLLRHLTLMFPRHSRILAIALAAAFVVLLHPALFMAAGSWSGLRAARAFAPDWFQMACVAAQFAALFSAVVFLPLAAVDWSRRLLTRKARTPDEARRRFLTGMTVGVPMASLGVSGWGVVASRLEPTVTRLRLPVPRDMSNLHGVTIAQVSDVHIGSFMGAERLTDFRDAMNALKADFHVITGDLLDNHINQMELSQFFLRGLQPRRGQTFLCMGNHEYIAARTADNGQIVRGIEEAGGQMLVDEARAIRVGGDHFWMSGVDYVRRGSISGQTDYGASLDAALAQARDDGSPRIVLAHHPRAFHEGRERQVDLMLAGHTHGGQMSLGRVGDYALTPMLPVELYHNGYYEHPAPDNVRVRRLYVNAGAGGWLPIRLNCPPEITLVELVPA